MKYIHLFEPSIIKSIDDRICEKFEEVLDVFQEVLDMLDSSEPFIGFVDIKEDGFGSSDQYVMYVPDTSNILGDEMEDEDYNFSSICTIIEIPEKEYENFKEDIGHAKKRIKSLGYGFNDYNLFYREEGGYDYVQIIIDYRFSQTEISMYKVRALILSCVFYPFWESATISKNKISIGLVNGLDSVRCRHLIGSIKKIDLRKIRISAGKIVPSINGNSIEVEVFNI